MHGFLVEIFVLRFYVNSLLFLSSKPLLNLGNIHDKRRQRIHFILLVAEMVERRKWCYVLLYPSENKHFYLPQAFVGVIKFGLLSFSFLFFGWLPCIDSISLRVWPAKMIIYAIVSLTEGILVNYLETKLCIIEWWHLSFSGLDFVSTCRKNWYQIP